NGQSHSYPQCQRSEDGGQRTEDRCPTRLTTSPKPFPSNRRTRSRGHSSSVLWSLSSDSGGADRARTGDPLLAKQVLSQLSYGPAHRSWWAREDLNFRPHAYQARALTS